MKRLAIVAVSVLALGGAFAAYKARSGRSGAELKSFIVKRGDLKKTVEASGVVEPMNSVEILPPIAGRVDRLLFEQGQRVKKGEILAWMSSVDRAAVLDAALAQGPEALAKWEKAYKPTPIVAPVSGLLIDRDVVEGQTVATGKKLFVMADRFIVRARVDESEIGRIGLGQKVDVVADAFPDETFEAKVRQIDFQSKSVGGVSAFDVELEPKVLPPGLRSGMTTRVNFFVGEKTGALLLPISAVRDGVEGATVELRVRRAGGPEMVSAKLGLTDGSSIEIAEGLEEGDEVLVEAPDFTKKPDAKNPFNPFGSGGGRGGRGGGGRRGR